MSSQALGRIISGLLAVLILSPDFILWVLLKDIKTRFTLLRESEKKH